MAIDKTKIRKIAKYAGAGLLGATVLFGCSGCAMHTDSYVEQQKADAVKEFQKSEAMQEVLAKAMDTGVKSVSVTSDNADAIKAAISGVEGAEYDETSGLVVIKQETSTGATDATPGVTGSYTKDEIKLGESVVIKLKNSKLGKLFDGTVLFNGEDIDAHEELMLTDSAVVMYSGAFDKELSEEVALGFAEKGAVRYAFALDESIDFEDIDEDTPLDVTFAGKKIRIVHYDPVEQIIKVKESRTGFANVGETFEGVTVQAIGEDSVRFIVGEESVNIRDGHSGAVAGVGISVDGIFPNGVSFDVGSASVVKTYHDGDAVEFLGEDKDEPNWVFDFDNGLAMKFNKRLDDSSEALKAGQSISLPNDFAKVTFLGTEPVKEVTFTARFDKVDMGTEDVPTTVLVIKSSSDEGITFGDDEQTDEIVFDGTRILVYDEESKDYAGVDGVLLNGLKPMTVNASDISFSFDDFKIFVDLEDEKFTNFEFLGKTLNGRDYDVVSMSGVKVKEVGELEDLDEIEFSVPEEEKTASVKIE